MSGDSPQGKQAIQATVKVAAPIASVWAAWTEPARLIEWYPDRVEGEIIPGAIIKLTHDARGLDQSFEVLDLEPRGRLRLRGASPDTLGQVLEVRFKEAEDNSTLVRLEHVGFGSGLEARQDRHSTASAWQITMAILRVYAEQYFERPRGTFAVTAEAAVAYENLYPYYTQTDFMRRWLTEEGSLAGVGEPCELVLRGDVRVTGELLTRYPPRDVALACREIGGVLVLCALPSDVPGRAGRVGAWVSSWKPADPKVTKLRAELSAAVERLVAALAAEEAE